MPLPYEKTGDEGGSILSNLDHLIETTRVVSVTGMTEVFIKRIMGKEIAALIRDDTDHRTTEVFLALHSSKYMKKFQQ